MATSFGVRGLGILMANSPLPIAHYQLPIDEQEERLFPCLSIGNG